ncbi:hypothetical protein [Flavobacterium sp.]|jgi:hypothetical protein|uniref:hypothetical protein n=1 Tax=Flavobacterium sp. TaxID=239 RepID=UPI0037BE7DA8
MSKIFKNSKEILIIKKIKGFDSEKFVNDLKSFLKKINISKICQIHRIAFRIQKIKENFNFKQVL